MLPTDILEIRRMIRTLQSSRSLGALSEAEDERYKLLCDAENAYLERTTLF